VKKNMQETRFQDLTLSLNKKYLYCHQGNCEHTFIFESVRQLIQSDSKDRNEYPQTVFQSKVKHDLCLCCKILPGRFIVKSDDFAPEFPVVYCEDCYERLHQPGPAVVYPGVVDPDVVSSSDEGTPKKAPLTENVAFYLHDY